VARALLICYRRPAAVEATEADILGLIERITPDNAPRPRPRIVRQDGVVAAVFAGGARSAALDGGSVRLGVLASPSSDWSRPLAPVPDGSFALCRVSADLVELVADAGATRTLWYVLTDDALVASTSQRAIAALLGDFEPNRDAAAWMLSSGTLGPGHGWDRRVRPVPPAGRVVLDRRTWRLHVRSSAPETDAERPADDEAALGRALTDAVDRAAAAPPLDYARWIVPLSGGVDSRGVLLALLRANRADRPRAVTWGRPAALGQRDGDAVVARAVADRVGVEHAFFPVELSDAASPRTVLDRFFAAGEGRVAALSGYLDGFAVWQTLSEQEVDGIVRGDEAFGWKPVASERDVRHKVSFTVLEDIVDERARSAFELPRQEIPEELSRRGGESLEDWRDRLYRQYRLPCMLSGLTDLKTPYVEVANPLLYSSVLAEARRLPEALRTDKRLWRRLVESWLPGVPFATRSAETPIADALADPRLLEIFVEELSFNPAAELLGREAAKALRAELEARLRRERRALSRRLAALPAGRRLLRSRRGGRLDAAVLGFRATIVARMFALLREDALFLGRAARQPRETGT